MADSHIALHEAFAAPDFFERLSASYQQLLAPLLKV